MNTECRDISDDVHGCCSTSAQDSDKRPERLKPVRLITRQGRDEIYCVITASLYLSYDSEAVGTGFSCRCDGEMSSGRVCVVGRGGGSLTMRLVSRLVTRCCHPAKQMWPQNLL